jgi:hypothetical protein
MLAAVPAVCSAAAPPANTTSPATVCLHCSATPFHLSAQGLPSQVATTNSCAREFPSSSRMPLVRARAPAAQALPCVVKLSATSPGRAAPSPRRRALELLPNRVVQCCGPSLLTDRADRAAVAMAPVNPCRLRCSRAPAPCALRESKHLLPQHPARCSRFVPPINAMPKRDRRGTR